MTTFRVFQAVHVLVQSEMVNIDRRATERGWPGLDRQLALLTEESLEALQAGLALGRAMRDGDVSEREHQSQALFGELKQLAAFSMYMLHRLGVDSYEEVERGKNTNHDSAGRAVGERSKGRSGRVPRD